MRNFDNNSAGHVVLEAALCTSHPSLLSKHFRGFPFHSFFSFTRDFSPQLKLREPADELRPGLSANTVTPACAGQRSTGLLAVTCLRDAFYISGRAQLNRSQAELPSLRYAIAVIASDAGAAAVRIARGRRISKMSIDIFDISKRTRSKPPPPLTNTVRLRKIVDKCRRSLTFQAVIYRSPATDDI